MSPEFWKSCRQIGLNAVVSLLVFVVLLVFVGGGVAIGSCLGIYSLLNLRDEWREDRERRRAPDFDEEKWRERLGQPTPRMHRWWWLDLLISLALALGVLLVSLVFLPPALAMGGFLVVYGLALWGVLKLRQRRGPS